MQNAINRLIRHAIAGADEGQTVIRALCARRLGHGNKLVAVLVFDGIYITRHVGKPIARAIADAHGLERVGDHPQVMLAQVGQVQ